jgi:hypothetical protein
MNVLKLNLKAQGLTVLPPFAATACNHRTGFSFDERNSSDTLASAKIRATNIAFGRTLFGSGRSSIAGGAQKGTADYEAWGALCKNIREGYNR